MPVLILGTATALAVSMSATAEPITAHLVLTIEGGVAESEVTPLFGPLHAGDALKAAITLDPGQPDLSSDQFNGTFESVSGSIGAIRLTHGEMATGTGPFPDSSHFFSGNVGGEPAGSGRVWFNFIWDRPAAFGDRLPQSTREIAGTARDGSPLTSSARMTRARCPEPCRRSRRRRSRPRCCCWAPARRSSRDVAGGACDRFDSAAQNTIREDVPPQRRRMARRRACSPLNGHRLRKPCFAPGRCADMPESPPPRSSVLYRLAFYVPRSSRASHALARRQSRITVCGETCSTWAVSSTLSPPKNRSSITFVRLGSFESDPQGRRRGRRAKRHSRRRSESGRSPLLTRVRRASRFRRASSQPVCVPRRRGCVA